jgi:hypothetical protein
LEYIEQNILKFLIYFLFDEKELELSKIDFMESSSFIGYLIPNELHDYFYFSVNKIEMNKDNDLFTFNEKFDKDMVGYVYQLVEKRRNEEKISFNCFMEDHKQFPYYFFTYTFYNLNINPKDRLKLQSFLKEYIKYFKKDDLIAQKNYFPFNTCIQKVCEILQLYYDKFGNKFGFSGNNTIDSIDTKIEEELRIHEIILYFVEENYIKIDSCSFIPLEKKYIMSIRLALNKSPNEIFNIENRKIKREKKKIVESKLKFDDEKSIISYEDKICEIPKWTNQYIICKTIFDHKIGEIIDEGEIHFALDRMKLKEVKRTIYDAIRTINKKAEEKLQIEHLLIWERSTVKINDSIAI